MSRILYAWELGQNLGHMLGFLPVAQELRQRGHEIVFVLKDLSKVELAIGEYGFTCLPAPVWLPKLAGLPPQLNYCEMLFRFGYLDSDALTGLVKAWRSLYELTSAELLVIDHAPTALLASRRLDIPRAIMGTGFYSPPRTIPLRPFRWWQKPLLERLLNSENVVLNTINRVQENSGLPTLSAVCEMFDADEDFLCTLKELDHYPGRKDAVYWGPQFSLDSGEVPAWPAAEGTRIFCYMYPHHKQFESTLAALSQLQACSLVYAPGIPKEISERFASEKLRFSDRPVNMGAVTESSAFIVCHGGHGTVSAALLAGKPLLIMPSQLEQSLMARRVHEQQLGLMVNPGDDGADIQMSVNRLLGEPGFAERAQAFAMQYESFDTGRQIIRIADRCEALLG